MRPGASVRTGDSGANMSDSQRIDPPISALFCKNRGHVRENIGNIFFDPAFLVTVGVGNVEASPMPDDWDERHDLVAAGSICPVPDCGAL